MFFGGDPFEHFAGMHGGGGPGGGGSRRGGGGGRQAAQDVDTTKLYETLGVSYHLSPVCVCVCVCRRCLFLGKGWRGRRRRCSRRAFRSLSSLNPTDCIHLSLSLSLSLSNPRNTSILAFETGDKK